MSWQASYSADFSSPVMAKFHLSHRPTNTVEAKLRRTGHTAIERPQWVIRPQAASSEPFQDCWDPNRKEVPEPCRPVGRVSEHCGQRRPEVEISTRVKYLTWDINYRLNDYKTPTPKKFILNANYTNSWLYHSLMWTEDRTRCFW